MQSETGVLHAHTSQDGAPELARLLRQAARIVVFTGAGVSTDCGIPDFRSPQGQWAKTMPIPYEDHVASPQARREAWRRKFIMQPFFDKAARETVHNSLTHTSIRKLHATGRVPVVITQNVDNLHQASGIPDDSVIELHGNGAYATCLTCDLRHELEHIRTVFEVSGDPPPCRTCGGILKTATISFGQPMPQDKMLHAHAETLACDLFLALGSSLVVHPAAALPALAGSNGATLVIVNNEPTPLDAHADLIIRGDIGEALSVWADMHADK